MRHPLLFLCCFFFAQFFPISQILSQSTHYTYDASGNRIMRQTIILQSSLAAAASDSTGSKLNNRFAEKIDQIQINLFPNPTLGIVNINVTNAPEHSVIEYEILDLSGNILQRNRAENNKFSADFSSLPTGTYFISLRTGTSQSSWKVIRN